MTEKEKMHHIENDPEFKGLNVNAGVGQQETVNDESVKRFLSKQRKLFAPEVYVEGILKGDITLLSKAVTLVESSKKEHQQVAQEIIKHCLPHSGKSIRVGITGVLKN